MEIHTRHMVVNMLLYRRSDRSLPYRAPRLGLRVYARCQCPTVPIIVFLNTRSKVDLCSLRRILSALIHVTQETW